MIPDELDPTDRLEVYPKSEGVPLDDVGLSGVVLVWSRWSDGVRDLPWLWQPGLDREHAQPVWPPAHEHDEPLTGPWLERCGVPAPRCEWTTRAGSPCRRRVRRWGDRCPDHRRAEARAHRAEHAHDEPS